ncbi:MAG: hypothetical protein V4580_04095 [Bacteroidota bacterium]
MKVLLITLYLLTSQLISAQSGNSTIDEQQRFQNILSTSTKTLVINTTSYPYATIREFKRELRGWNEKVLSADIDTVQKTFTIVHNKLMHPKEMEDFWKKYNIKSSSIISYN